MRSAHVTDSTANAEFSRSDYRTQMQSLASDSLGLLSPTGVADVTGESALNGFPRFNARRDLLLKLLLQAAAAFSDTQRFRLQRRAAARP